MNDPDDKYAELEKVDAEVPALTTCKGKCAILCRQIRMSTLEEERIEAFRGAPIPDYEKSGVCPLLKDGRCSVYPVRPWVCRAWGAAVPMACGWGCQPASPFLTTEETQLAQRSLRAGGGESPRQIERLRRFASLAQTDGGPVAPDQEGEVPEQPNRDGS